MTRRRTTPSGLRALWGLAHTKDLDRAKAFVAPLGVSGLYQEGECCVLDGRVWRSLVDNNAYSPAESPQNWEQLTK